jgi:hypothetical protein
VVYNNSYVLMGTTTPWQQLVLVLLELGTLKTTANVNLRKSYSTKTARMAVVPSGTSLSYTAPKLPAESCGIT